MRSTCRAFSFSSRLFFFNDTATTEIYTLSLHDALPICLAAVHAALVVGQALGGIGLGHLVANAQQRSEEHTSELQSHSDLVCRLLLEKKKNNTIRNTPSKDTDSPLKTEFGTQHDETRTQ